MKTAKNIMILKNVVLLAVVFVLGTPIFVSAATECSVGNMSGLKVNGQCVFFSKGEDVHSKYGCSAQNPSGYGVSMFPCPTELLKEYDEKIAAEQEKITAEKEEAERRADEELDKKIRDAVADQAKQNEREQVVPVQTSAIAEPTASSQSNNPPVPVEVITKTPPTSIPTADVSAESLDDSTVSESAPTEIVENAEKKTSLWEHFSGFLSRLNPFSWFK